MRCPRISGKRQRLAVLRLTVNQFPSGKHWRFNSSLPNERKHPFSPALPVCEIILGYLDASSKNLNCVTAGRMSLIGVSMVAEWWFKSTCGHNSSKKGSRRFFPNVLGDTKKIRQCSHNWNWNGLLSRRAFIRLVGSSPTHCASVRYD